MTKASDRRHGRHFAKIVKWTDDRGLHRGIVEGQRDGFLDIYVFNKELFGNRRTSRKVEDIEFCQGQVVQW